MSLQGTSVLVDPFLGRFSEAKEVRRTREREEKEKRKNIGILMIEIGNGQFTSYLLL